MLTRLINDFRMDIKNFQAPPKPNDPKVHVIMTSSSSSSMSYLYFLHSYHYKSNRLLRTCSQMWPLWRYCITDGLTCSWWHFAICCLAKKYEQKPTVTHLQCHNHGICVAADWLRYQLLGCSRADAPTTAILCTGMSIDQHAIYTYDSCVDSQNLQRVLPRHVHQPIEADVVSAQFLHLPINDTSVSYFQSSRKKQLRTVRTDLRTEDRNLLCVVITLSTRTYMFTIFHVLLLSDSFRRSEYGLILTYARIIIKLAQSV